MSFKQQVREELARGLDETYRVEDWAQDFPGRKYFDRHVTTIEQHEMVAPVFAEFLNPEGMTILESGCGTGRWMAFFEQLGCRSVGLDDSWGPLAVAREHDAAMRLVRADALLSPFKHSAFDAAFSSYVAEHFEDGPETLFREIYRVLKPGGLFFVVVPYNNPFRRLVVNPILRLLCLIWRLQNKPLAFTEFRYTQAEMRAFLARANFEILRMLPDDFVPPWSKGLFVDLCDLGSFFNYAPKPPYGFGPWGTRVARLIQRLGVWHSCSGVFCVARAGK